MYKITINTEKYQPFSQEELNQLLIKAQNGCVISKEKIIESNLKLVLKIVHRFKGREHEFEDLFQVGVIGLVKCVENFDVGRGLKFSTYAFPMVIGEMKRYLRDHTGSLKVSRTIKEHNQKILTFREEFLQNHHREPTVTETSEALGLSEEDVLLAMDAHLELISFSQTTKNGEDKEVALEEKLTDKKDPYERWLLSEEIKNGLGMLTDTEKMIIEKRYFQNKVQQEIAEELSISQAQVSRLEKKSLKKLRNII